MPAQSRRKALGVAPSIRRVQATWHYLEQDHPMPDPILMAKAFGIAVAISLSVTLLGGRSSRKTVAAATAVFATVSALYAGLWILDLLPHAPPREALDRLLLIVLPAAAVAELLAAASGRIGWVGRGAVAISVTPVLLWGSVYTTDLSGANSRAWSTAVTWGIDATLGILLMAAWVLTNRLAARDGGRISLVSLAGTALGAGLVIMLSGYATGGQLAVPLAAGLAGIALGSVLRKSTEVNASAAGVGIVTVFGLLVIGRLFASLTTFNAVLLFVAPLCGWAAEAMRSRPRFRAGLRLGLVALPVVVAMVLAQQKFASDSHPTGSPAEGSLDDYTSFGK
jgi:hypothetical protein